MTFKDQDPSWTSAGGFRVDHSNSAGFQGNELLQCRDPARAPLTIPTQTPYLPVD